MYYPQAAWKMWQVPPHHKEKMLQWYRQVEKTFTEHPASAGETYWRHAWFAMKIAARLFIASALMLVHGLFPFVFGHAVSRQVTVLYKRLRRRISKIRRIEIDPIFLV